VGGWVGLLPPSILHLIPYPLHFSTSYNVDLKPQALYPTSFALQSILHPCTVKPNFKAQSPLRHCPSTSCFSPFASLASSEYSDFSPCSRSTPPPAPPPVPPHPLCLFSCSPAASCSTTDAATTKTCCPSPEPPAIMCLCLCRSKSVCACCVSQYAHLCPDVCVCVCSCVCAHVCVRACQSSELVKSSAHGCIRHCVAAQHSFIRKHVQGRTVAHIHPYTYVHRRTHFNALRIKDKTTVSEESVGRGFSMMS